MLIQVLNQVQKVCSPKKVMKQTHSELFNKKSEFQRHLDRYEVPITWRLDRIATKFLPALGTLIMMKFPM